MRRLLPLLALLATACGGGEPVSGRIGLSVTPGVAEVEVGRGFPVVVVRTFRRGMEPAPFDERSFDPLAFRLLGTDRSGDAEMVRETRRYLAFAFAPGEAVLPGGARVRVFSTLDPADPGPPERPEPPGGRPPLLPWLAAGGALAAAAFLLLVRRRAPGRPPAPATPPAPASPPPPGPDEAALAALAALRSRRPGSREEDVAFHAEGARIVRGYVAARFGLPTAVRTTEECQAVLPAQAGDLGRVLLPADLVKFARRETGEADRARFLDDAEAFVRRHRPGGAS